MLGFSCSINKYEMCQTAGAEDGSSLFTEQMLCVCARIDCLAFLKYSACQRKRK